MAIVMTVKIMSDINLLGTPFVIKPRKNHLFLLSKRVSLSTEESFLFWFRWLYFHKSHMLSGTLGTRQTQIDGT